MRTCRAPFGKYSTPAEELETLTLSTNHIDFASFETDEEGEMVAFLKNMLDRDVENRRTFVEACGDFGFLNYR